MRIRTGLVLACFTFVALPVHGQTTLEWKLKEGDKFFMKNVTITKQTVEVAGQKTPMGSTQTTISSMTVLKKTADTVVLRQQVEEQLMQAEGPAAAVQQRAAQLMKGAVMTFTLDTKGRVTKFEGYEELVQRLSEGNPDVAKGIRITLTEETLKQAIQEAFTMSPGKPVRKGDSWLSKMSMSMGPIGQFSVDQTYTYQGTDKGLEVISLKAAFKHMPPANADSGLGFRVVKSNMAAKRAVGSLRFDAKRGRLVSHDFAAQLEGNMTLDVNGKEVSMKMDIDMNTKLSWSDTMPKP